MSRSRNSKNNGRGGEMQEYGHGMDPFQEMHREMRSFGGMGGFGGGDFFGGMMSDPFEEMMNFSGAHKNMHGSNNGGSYVCQTYVSSSTMGKDGKMKKESYYENTAGQNQKGQSISERHQAYKNNDGVKRIAEERMLNDKGRKMVKEQRGDRPEELINHYYNLEENEAESFDRNWNEMNKETKFLENAQKVRGQMGQLGNGGGLDQTRQIGYEPRRDSGRQPQQYRPIEQSNYSRGSKGSKAYQGNGRGKY